MRHPAGRFSAVKWSIVVGVCAVAVTTVGCHASEGSGDPPDTVGSLPIADVATTLLPDVVVSYVPDDTLPPGVLFAGQLCTALTADDFAYILRHSGAKVVCAHPDYFEAIERIRSQTPAVQHLVALEGLGDHQRRVVGQHDASVIKIFI